MLEHLWGQISAQLRDYLGLVLLLICHFLRDDDPHIILRFLLPWTSTATTCMILSRIRALRRLAIVLLLDMSVQSRVAQVALAAPADECSADIVVFGATLATCVAAHSVRTALLITLTVLALRTSALAIVVIVLSIVIFLIRHHFCYYFFS